MSRDDLESAADRVALAAILEARGRSREARETLLEVLLTLESVLGPGHYEVAVTLTELAEMHMSAGRFSDADAALTRAAQIFERVLGSSHPTAAASRARSAQARARGNGQGG